MAQMRERVMAAMWEANKTDPDGRVFGSPIQQSDLDVIAKAAIAAMFEPTYRMIRAAETKADSNLFDCPTVGWECVTLIYKAMIQEAIYDG